MIQNELIKNKKTKKQTHSLRKYMYGYLSGKVGEGDKLGVWGWHTHSTIFKIENQQGPNV